MKDQPSTDKQFTIRKSIETIYNNVNVYYLINMLRFTSFRWNKLSLHIQLKCLECDVFIISSLIRTQPHLNIIIGWRRHLFQEQWEAHLVVDCCVCWYKDIHYPCESYIHEVQQQMSTHVFEDIFHELD